LAELHWSDPVELRKISARALRERGTVFQHEDYIYLTTGEELGQGGMGTAYVCLRRPVDAENQVEEVVAKVFHDEYLYQLRTDAVTREDHKSVLENLGTITKISHPHLLPTYIADTIADNFLAVSPRKASTLHELVATDAIGERTRVELLIGAIRGLGALHDIGVIHRDFTLRNILVDGAKKGAFLFDFDLSLCLADVRGQTYRDRYQGRIFGSPGYSVAPEILDAVLMDCEITPRLDVYAVGGALFNLFTDQLPYGPTEDMWGLLLRISDGIVFKQESRVVYPASIPMALRPVIEHCLERNPSDRYASTNALISALEGVLEHLDEEPTSVEPRGQTLRYGGIPKSQRVKQVVRARRDATVSEGTIWSIDEVLHSFGYEIQRSLGRVKDYPIFLAAPDPELVAAGRFPDVNTYPKIVTVLDLSKTKNPVQVVDLWLGGYLPILRSARQGLLTSLYRVAHSGDYLLLFSEFVDDARFGTDLDDIDLSLVEALCIAHLVACQVKRLHRRGMAHNNISPNSLLLKGDKVNRTVRPAMVGLVAPSMETADMVADVRKLAELATCGGDCVRSVMTMV
jgi:serine/threonine protein kinase